MTVLYAVLAFTGLVLWGIVSHLDKRLKRFGPHALAWRWLSAAAWHGNPVTDRRWTRPGTKALTAIQPHRRCYLPRWQHALWRMQYTIVTVLMCAGLVFQYHRTLDYLEITAVAGAGFGLWHGRSWLQTYEHRRNYVTPAHTRLAPIAGVPLANKPESWIEVAKDRRYAKLTWPKHARLPSPPEREAFADAAASTLGMVGATRTWRVTGGPQIELCLRAAPALDADQKAIAYAAGAVGDFLKEVKVKALAWEQAGEEPPEDAGVAWRLRTFEIRFERDKRLTLPASRDAIRIHLGTQLYNDPGILRAEWNVATQVVTMSKRPVLPSRVPHRPADPGILERFFAGLSVIVYGSDEDGNPAAYQLSHTDAPHKLVTGGTGTGKTVTMRVLMLDAARQGFEVRGADPKRVEMRGLRGWPNITRIATRVPDMIALVEDTYFDMLGRYAAIEEGRARREDFQRIVLFIDEFLMFGMLINDWWAEERLRLGGQQPKEHPVMRKVRSLVVLSRGANMNLVVATQRSDAEIFPEGVRDSIGARLALGRQTKESALMMFGDATVGRDIPLQSQGVGVALAPAGPVRVKADWLPDPADWPDRFNPEDGDPDEQRALLLAMLPPGSTWDGPLPYQPSEPGTGAGDGGARITVGRADVRLLYFVGKALSTRDAHLTDASTGGAPADGAEAARYGWHPGPDGTVKPSGTWIGCVTAAGGDRRVYLHPDRAIEISRRLAGPLGVPFPHTRTQLDAALRASALLETETVGGKQRYTVRRQLPGNDLPGDDRQRVWDLPAREILASHDDTDDLAVEALSEAIQGMPVREAHDLGEGTRIILVGDDGQARPATVQFINTDGGDLVIDYSPDGGPPGHIRVQPGQHIRLAAEDAGT